MVLASEGKAYGLVDDQSFTLTDLALEIAGQTGKDIPYLNLSEIEYAPPSTGWDCRYDNRWNSLMGWQCLKGGFAFRRQDIS